MLPKTNPREKQDQAEPFYVMPSMVLQDEPELNQPVLQPESAPGPLKRILVVDDEKYITFMLKEGLEELPNCEIVTASTGEQALLLCQAQPFDMLISDYRMTGIDGLTLAAQVRQAQPQTVVIMLTAHSSEILLAQAAKISIRRVLNKPVKLPEIRQLVSEVLDSKSNNIARTSHSFA
ncbi:MAG: response regulator [Anaerolineales bacterium]|nr:response regulator [Anaerolineales bacterium]